MATDTLGDFEKLVLIAILHLRRSGDEDVYGVPIMDEIHDRTGRSVSRAAVYVALRRLERKGYVASWLGDSRPERGGKARRCVNVTDEGEAVLRESQRVLDSMWGELAPEADRP